MAIDQRKLKQELLFSGQGTASELMADLEQVSALEASVGKRIRMIRWSALAAFVLMLGLAITYGGPFGILCVVVPLGLLIYSLVGGKKGILPDRIQFLKLLLKTLSRDAGEKRKITVSLKLKSNREKLHEREAPGRQGAKEAMFRDAWLTLSGRLEDGTTIREGCVDLIRVRTRKNTRGKTKSKERRICLLRVQLNYDAGTYSNVQRAAAQVKGPFRLPLGAAMKEHRFTEKALAMKTIVKGDVTAENLVRASEGMLLGAYRILNLARHPAAISGGAR
jgi:hypothetical protein